MSLSAALWGTFLLLQCVDIASTYKALQRVTGAYEANPLLRWVFERVGPLPGMLLIKGVMCGALWYMQAPALALGVLCAVYALVVGNNIRILMRGK